MASLGKAPAEFEKRQSCIVKTVLIRPLRNSRRIVGEQGHQSQNHNPGNRSHALPPAAAGRRPTFHRESIAAEACANLVVQKLPVTAARSMRS